MLFNKVKTEIENIGGEGLAQNLYDISLYCINKNLGIEVAIEILNDIYENRANPEYACTREAFYKTIKLLSYISYPKSGVPFINEYVELFQKERYGEIDYVDIENFANYIYVLIEQKQFKKAFF